MLRILLSPAVVGLLAALTACDGVGPQQGSLRLEATISRSPLRFGDTTSLVFRLRNLGDDSVTLTFPNSCQILPYVETRAGGHTVYPSGGAWGCFDAITTLTIGPREEDVRRVVVRGGAAPLGAQVALMPGGYIAFARLDHADVHLKSAAVSFTVR